MARARPRVLHVDDDPAVRRAVERTLGGAGFVVTSAADPVEGLAAALRGRWALVVLDVDLPGMTGFELCERLRAEPRTRPVPVLHLSAARVDVRDRVRGLEAGADAYLVQPVAPEELVAVARALVARGAAARSRAAPSGGARAVAAAREEALRLAVHLLRPPLSAISINASSLAGAAGDPVGRARATTLVEAHTAAVQTLADLEELAWLESSRTPLPLEPRAPSEIAAGAARRAAPVAEHAGVTLAVEASGAPPLRCDPGRLEQALDALLRRALRSSERGATVTLRAAATADGVRFSVEGGPAGPAGEDARAQLEQDLWSFRAARGAPELLALALARAIVSAHGGQLTLDPAATHVDVPLSPLMAAFTAP